VKVKLGSPLRPDGVEESWGDAVRSSPVGVLVLAAGLLFVGAGAIVGGIYLILFSTTAIGWWGWAMLLLAAPVSLYVALSLLRRSAWVWLTMVAALLLLLATSLLRILISPGIPSAAIGEVVVEIVFLTYLMRPRVRAAFGRG
jgi:hypothetical protein